MNLNYGELTWEEIEKSAKEGYILVLLLGAIEQHGPMLPIDTDSRLAERWADEGAREARERFGVKVLVMPLLPYGQSCHHMNFPGTISLRFETYISVISDILREVIRHGFSKIVIINGDGGNDASIQVARYKVMEEMALQGKVVRIYNFEHYSNPDVRRGLEKVEKDLPQEGQLAIHASRPEVAETLADRKHLVRIEKMARPLLKLKREPKHAWRTEEISESGAFGDPSLATEELGNKYWQIWKIAIARYLLEVSKEEF
ncbi:MAG: creatininase family protein [Thermoproteota archaeon]